MRHLNNPKSEDPGDHPILGWDFSNQSRGAQTVVEQVFAGNLDAVGPDMGGDGFLANVTSTAGLLVSQPLSTARLIPRHIRLTATC